LSRGIAQNFVDFRLNRASGGEIVNDYPGNPPTLRPGYLTSQQVQPTEVKTPAIENGVNVGQNVVSIAYTVLGGGLPDGTGKIYGVDDPEGRTVGLGYGSNAARNDMAGMSGPGGTEVSNTYFQSGEFTGRVQESLTERNGLTLSTTTYAYAIGFRSRHAKLLESST
jgi:hypothetical protein